MAIKIHVRWFTSLLLCCLLVLGSLPVQVHATDPVTAASLAITGGQLAGAGLSGEAALSLAGPVGAVVGVTLGALGVNAYVSQAAQEAGKTRTRFVLDKLVIWGAQAGYTQEQLYSKIAQGISVAADGTIQLGKDVAEMVSQFGSWLFTQEGTVVPSLSTGDNTLNFRGYTFPSAYNISACGSSFGTQHKDITISSIAAVYVGTFNGVQMFFSKESFSVHSLSRWWSSSSWSSSTSTASYNSRAHAYSVSLNTTTSDQYYTPSLNVPRVSSQFQDFFSSSDAWDEQGGAAQDEVFTGTPEAWAENKDVLNPSADDIPITLNPDLLNPIIDSLTDGQQATMSIIDYLQALQDAWDHALDDVQTAIGTITDTLTGIQEQIAIPQTAVENPTVTNPSVTPDTTPILDPSEVDPGTAITGMSFDLTNIFPFCIPFDIYAALSLLDAEPVAPSYHFHLEWPYNIVIDFTLDLSPFNQVAAVARTMEILLFIIGLAAMTRSMFIRG